MSKMKRQEILNDPNFKRLKKQKWTISFIFGTILIVFYYGFILLMAYNKSFFGNMITEGITVGIPLGIFLILGTITVTTFYVIWANKTYDDLVDKVRARITG